MWLNDGINSGKIISIELTPFSGKENLPEAHIKVMEHAHDLYIRALKISRKVFGLPCLRINL
jgi:hypothetical protein